MDYALTPDLARRAAELAEAGHPTGHVRGRALYTDEHVKVLAFPFEPGRSLDERAAPHPAVLHVLSGGAAAEARAGTCGTCPQASRTASGPDAGPHAPARLPRGAVAAPRGPDGCAGAGGPLFRLPGQVTPENGGRRFPYTHFQVPPRHGER